MATLIVPIDLEALAVGLGDTKADAKTQVPMADFSQLAYLEQVGGNSVAVPSATAYLGTQVLGEAIPFAGTTNFVGGIHLHWALPDGLTHGIQPKDASQPPVFFSAPNRWLVTRIVIDSTNPAAPVASTLSWVIESDRLLLLPDTSLADGIIQPTIPTNPTQPDINTNSMQSYRYIGQVFDAATWQEDAGDTTIERLTPFTATGYGETAFAAYYPNCNTVFGFHDTLDDLTSFNPATMKVSYQVAGWYANASDDPLQQITIDPDKNELQWRFTKGETPTSTICTGFIENIPWDPNGIFLDDSQNPITAAIGFSAPEAMSALLNALPAIQANVPNAETLLNALQFGFLSKSGTIPDALQKLDEAVHSAGFAVLDGGSLWQLKTENGQAMPTLDPTVQEIVKKINDRERSYIKKQHDLVAAQTQLFADWVKYMIFTYSGPQVPALDNQADAVNSFVQTNSSAVAQLAKEVDEHRKHIDKDAQELISTLPPNVTFTKSLPEQRYSQPHDPVLALYGDDVVPAIRYGGDGKKTQDSYLLCRLDDEIITAVNLPDNFVMGSSAITQPASQFVLPSVPSTAPLQTIIQELIQETYLLAASMQGYVAGVIATQGGSTNPAVLDVGTTANNLASWLPIYLAKPLTNNALYTGLSPDNLQTNSWNGTPWLPILLQYEFNFAPVQYINTANPQTAGAQYDPDFIVNNFSWNEDDTELSYSGTLPPSTSTYSYTGTVSLTPNGTAAIQGALKSFIRHQVKNTDELKTLLTDIQSTQQLSQGLSGTVQAMMMQEQTLQMPVWDPLSDTATQQSIIQPAASAIGSATGVAPNPQVPFNPIRTGVISLVELALVDVFGRMKTYQGAGALNVVLAQSFQNTTSQTLNSGDAFLPPRLSQPSRLGFSWLPPFNPETISGVSDTSSIFGWVMTDDLENGLFIYSATGIPIGEFLSQGSSVAWLPAPGGAAIPGSSLTDTLTAFNLTGTDLADFLTQIYNNGDANFFTPFLNTVTEAQLFMLPANASENADTAVLFGRPLVLAHASIKIELQGPPSPDQSWTDFANLAIGLTTSPNTAGFEQVLFPLRLGALSQLNDGLAGFWITQNKATTYTQFYSSYVTAENSNNGVQQPSFNQITLLPGGPAIQVTMLFDPRSPVHISTTILPVYPAKIPQQEYSETIGALNVNFLTAPILSGTNTGTVDIPIPQETQGTWSWISPAVGGWTTLPLSTDSAAQSGLNYSPQQLIDGWMQLNPEAPAS